MSDPSDGDAELIISHYEHIGAVPVKMVYVAEDGWWVSDEWLKEQETKEVSVSSEQLPLFE